MYKMVAVDLDGTMLNSYGEVTENTKRVIKQTIQKGTEVIIASGRSIDSIKTIANEIGSTKYMIAGNGAVVYDIKNDKIVYEKYIPKNKAIDIIKTCEQNSIYYNVYTNKSIIASSFVALFLFIISTVICLIFGFRPNILMAIYILVAAYAFIIAVTRFTSSVTTLVPDFSQLLNILMQLFFWFTPIVWNLNMLSGHNTLLKIVQCMPFTYLVTGFREVFIEGNIVTQGHGIYTIAFWVITIAIFMWGNYIFKKSKKDFADVL